MLQQVLVAGNFKFEFVFFSAGVPEGVALASSSTASSAE